MSAADDISMRLPIRLVPRRGGQVFKLLFFLFFFGFAVFWTVTASTILWTNQIDSEPFPGFRYVFPAFGLPFLIVGFLGTASAILKMLPGGAYYHVEISKQGIAVRRAWKIRQFAWSEISPFGISVKTRSTKGGRVTTYWVVALRAVDEGQLANESERYNRSVLQINAGEYADRDAGNAASVLADWLSGIRAEAIDRPGRAADTVAVPPDFRGAAVAITAGPDVAAPAKRSSVIER